MIKPSEWQLWNVKTTQKNSQHIKTGCTVYFVFKFSIINYDKPLHYYDFYDNKARYQIIFSIHKKFISIIIEI